MIRIEWVSHWAASAVSKITSRYAGYMAEGLLATTPMGALIGVSAGAASVAEAVLTGLYDGDCKWKR